MIRTLLVGRSGDMRFLQLAVVSEMGILHQLTI